MKPIRRLLSAALLAALPGTLTPGCMMAPSSVAPMTVESPRSGPATDGAERTADVTALSDAPPPEHAEKAAAEQPKAEAGAGARAYDPKPTKDDAYASTSPSMPSTKRPLSQPMMNAPPPPKPTGGEGLMARSRHDGPMRIATEEARRELAGRKMKSMDKEVGRVTRDEPDDATADGDTVEGGTFISAGINDLIDTRVDAQSTFAADVDTGSYTLARRYLLAGGLPPAEGTRVEEWVNAFHYSYADTSAEHPFSIHVEGAPLSKNSHVVRIGIQGKRIDKEAREPAHLTFLVDVSGSMSPADRLPMAKQAMSMLVSELNSKDSVSIVTYAGSTSVVLADTAVTSGNKRKIFDAIDSLRNGGGTNMGSGMELAYREATKALAKKGSSRVIVLSDGDANIGRIGHKDILDSIKGYVSEGVTMSTVGFGTGNYRDHTMERLADAGNGNYSYVGSLTDAKKVFVDDLTGTLQVIAKDTKIQVEMNPAVVEKYRLIGYENRDVHDEDFRNDKVDAGEIGAGHTVTALYEIVLREDASVGDMATIHVRYKQPKGTKATEVTTTFTAQQLAKDVRSLSSDGRFAVGVGLAAESMRNSPHMARLGLNLADAHALMSSALDGEHASERKEIVGLIAPLAGGTGVARR